MKDTVLNGVHIGEHSFVCEKISDELMERCIKPGYDFVTIRTPGYLVPEHYFLEWAKLLSDNKVYFVFLYTIQRVSTIAESQFTAETVKEMKKIAGKYFLGDMLGEVGSALCCKLEGYSRAKVGGQFVTAKNNKYFQDMQEAHSYYVSKMREYVNLDRQLGIPNVFTVEATGLNKYNNEAGIDISTLELMCGAPDLAVSSLRGAARAAKNKLWGTYVAHEWYGGMRHNDELKRKRLKIAYNYAYLSGSNIFCLESGDESINSFGITYDSSSQICKDYREVMNYMRDFKKKDKRPKGGPKVKFGLVSGLHDAFGIWGASAIWNQYDRPDFAHGDAEHSWRIAEEIGTKRMWYDIGNYGDNDTSETCAYGMYDVVPIEAPLEILEKYEYLVFVGFNTMTNENLDKLTKYVENGGNLLISMAHMNMSYVRNSSHIFPDNDKFEKLFGAVYTGKDIDTNNGIKFKDVSLNDKLMYQGTKNLTCDPLFSSGFVNYAKMKITDGYCLAHISDCFEDNDTELIPAVIEHKLGKGIATLITSNNYPGNPAHYPLYRSVVREMISSSSRNCEIKVISGDRLRYAVYEGDKIYLLNTDYDLPITAVIQKGENRKQITIQPTEMKTITMK